MSRGNRSCTSLCTRTARALQIRCELVVVQFSFRHPLKLDLAAYSVSVRPLVDRRTRKHELEWHPDAVKMMA